MLSFSIIPKHSFSNLVGQVLDWIYDKTAVLSVKGILAKIHATFDLGIRFSAEGEHSISNIVLQFSVACFWLVQKPTLQIRLLSYSLVRVS